jgi:membrane-associated phospholipid phosphatase
VSTKNPFRPTEAQSRAATRKLFAGYLFISGLALLFPHRPVVWPVLAAMHAAFIAILLWPGPTTLREASTVTGSRVARVVRDWYALALIPLLYTELAILNVAVWNGRYFDPLIIGWEERLFGGHPFTELARAFPNLLVSEWLHFSYISYYLIIYVPPLYLYLRGRRAEQQLIVFVLMLTFFAHYFFFIYFPVQGPRYLYPAPGGEIANGFFYNLAHRLLEAGSSRGAAFPSSHVGVSIAASACAFLVLPRIAWVLLLLTIGLAVGAVYGGFHYATDATVGFAYGLLLFALAIRVLKRSPARE